jgi:hypothetical protein
MLCCVGGAAVSCCSMVCMYQAGDMTVLVCCVCMPRVAFLDASLTFCKVATNWVDPLFSGIFGAVSLGPTLRCVLLRYSVMLQ